MQANHSPPSLPPGLDLSRIRAVSLDLDDTLWPIWPTIARAEQALQAWLATHAPGTTAITASSAALRRVRESVQHERPDLQHDMSAMRQEAIRRVLLAAGEDEALAQPAFEVFFAARQQVDLFADALPALEFLAERFPLVALSNGNADVHRVGLGQYFRHALSARAMGFGKPDPRIFHAAAETLGVAPDEVLHVGDDAQLDGVGALRAGMQMAWVNRDGQDWPHPPWVPHATVADLQALCTLLAA